MPRLADVLLVQTHEQISRYLVEFLRGRSLLVTVREVQVDPFPFCSSRHDLLIETSRSCFGIASAAK